MCSLLLIYGCAQVYVNIRRIGGHESIAPVRSVHSMYPKIDFLQQVFAPVCRWQMRCVRVCICCSGDDGGVAAPHIFLCLRVYVVYSHGELGDVCVLCRRQSEHTHTRVQQSVHFNAPGERRECGERDGWPAISLHFAQIIGCTEMVHWTLDYGPANLIKYPRQRERDSNSFDAIETAASKSPAKRIDGAPCRSLHKSSA